MSKPPDPPCSRKGCYRSGRYVPMICVPPSDCANNVASLMMKAIIKFPLCTRHFQQIKAEDFLNVANPMMREAFEKMAKNGIAKYGSAPDFNRASIKRIRIGSREYMSTPLAGTAAETTRPRVRT